MAELIPMEYRLGVMRQRLLVRWGIVAAVAALISGASVSFAYLWQQKQEKTFVKLDSNVRQNATLITQGTELHKRQVELAARINKIMQLQDDRTLLALLKNVSAAFSDNDAVTWITIVAHNTDLHGAAAGASEDHYSVHLQGITRDSGSHKNLYNRLTEIGKESSPQVEVKPPHSKLDKFLDGDVFSFDIACVQPGTK